MHHCCCFVTVQKRTEKYLEIEFVGSDRREPADLFPALFRRFFAVVGGSTRSRAIIGTEVKAVRRLLDYR